MSIFLSGYTDAESLRKSRELGGYFETLVYLSLRGLCEVLTPRAQIYYWRTSTKREVDFVLEYGRKILPVEAKITRNPTISDAKNLLAFMEEHPRASQGVIVHGGNELLRLHSRILAVPWWWLDR